MRQKIKRKVVCVIGEYGESSDFVLEPVCSLDCHCEICKDGFWIENVAEKN